MRVKGTLSEVIRGTDVFIGVSGKAGILNKQMVESMNRDCIVLALSNPDPEVYPAEALAAGARVVATGRSDFPNQVNNAVVFPSLLPALLDLRVNTLSPDLLVPASHSMADLRDHAQ